MELAFPRLDRQFVFTLWIDAKQIVLKKSLFVKMHQNLFITQQKRFPDVCVLKSCVIHIRVGICWWMKLNLKHKWNEIYMMFSK